MKFYVIKPKSVEVDEQIVAGMLNIDPQAVAAPSLEECEIAILQKGWTRSKSAIQEYHKAHELHIPCREGYMYTDKYSIHLN